MFRFFLVTGIGLAIINGWISWWLWRALSGTGWLRCVLCTLVLALGAAFPLLYKGHGDTLAHMWLLRAGRRPQVWDRFDPRSSPEAARAAGRFGSDQGWISHVLGPGEATWSRADGVYSFRVHLLPSNPWALPANARIVMFHGRHDPWDSYAQRLTWVREAYQ